MLLVNGVAEEYRALLGQCRARVLARLNDAPCAHVLTQHFEGGKMLRALSVFLAAAAVRGDPSRAGRAADSVEILHGASLVHDDIADRAELRRGKPAVQAQVGSDTALVLGDYLVLLSFEALNEARFEQPAERVLEALREFGKDARACCRGQIEDLQTGPAISAEAYFRIAQQKTAASFSAALTLGAIFGGGSRAEIEALRGYAVNLGVAFQIRDDVLDVTATPSELGKPIGNSVAQARPSLPVIYLLKHGSPAARDAYRAVERRTPAHVRSLMEAEGIFERVYATQAAYVRSAQRALTGLTGWKGVDGLRELAEYAGKRHH